MRVNDVKLVGHSVNEARQLFPIVHAPYFKGDSLQPKLGCTLREKAIMMTRQRNGMSVSRQTG
jgi:hypothetical protein